jgi:predicted aldo/keto reductase-like oxidoreductase
MVYRWLQDPMLDISTIPPVTYNHSSTRESPLGLFVKLPAPTQTNPFAFNNLLDSTQAAPTSTVPQRLAFHEVHSAVRPLLTGVNTREDLDDVLQEINDMRYVKCSEKANYRYILQCCFKGKTR